MYKERITSSSKTNTHSNRLTYDFSQTTQINMTDATIDGIYISKNNNYLALTKLTGVLTLFNIGNDEVVKNIKLGSFQSPVSFVKLFKKYFFTIVDGIFQIIDLVQYQKVESHSFKFGFSLQEESFCIVDLDTNIHAFYHSKKGFENKFKHDEFSLKSQKSETTSKQIGNQSITLTKKNKSLSQSMEHSFKNDSKLRHYMNSSNKINTAQSEIQKNSQNQTQIKQIEMRYLALLKKEKEKLAKLNLSYQTLEAQNQKVTNQNEILTNKNKSIIHKLQNAESQNQKLSKLNITTESINTKYHDQDMKQLLEDLRDLQHKNNLEKSQFQAILKSKQSEYQTKLNTIREQSKLDQETLIEKIKDQYTQALNKEKSIFESQIHEKDSTIKDLAHQIKSLGHQVSQFRSKIEKDQLKINQQIVKETELINLYQQEQAKNKKYAQQIKDLSNETQKLNMEKKNMIDSLQEQRLSFENDLKTKFEKIKTKEITKIKEEFEKNMTDYKIKLELDFNSLHKRQKEKYIEQSKALRDELQTEYTDQIQTFKTIFTKKTQEIQNELNHYKSNFQQELENHKKQQQNKIHQENQKYIQTIIQNIKNEHQKQKLNDSALLEKNNESQIKQIQQKLNKEYQEKLIKEIEQIQTNFEKQKQQYESHLNDQMTKTIKQLQLKIQQENKTILEKSKQDQQNQNQITLDTYRNQIQQEQTQTFNKYKAKVDQETNQEIDQINQKLQKEFETKNTEELKKFQKLKQKLETHHIKKLSNEIHRFKKEESKRLLEKQFNQIKKDRRIFFSKDKNRNIKTSIFEDLDYLFSIISNNKSGE